MKTSLGIFALALLASVTRNVAANEVIANLVRKLGLGQEYVREPCRLMPFVELSPLLTMGQLTKTDEKTLKKAQKVYYKIGLNGMMYAGCLLMRNLTESKARAVINQWVSGYDNKQRQKIVLHDFEMAITDGKNAKDDQECLTKSIDRLRGSEVSKNPDGLIEQELKQQQEVMKGKRFTAAELKAATETIAMECLTTTSGLNDHDKTMLVNALTKASRFFHHVEGSVLRTITGYESQSEAMRILIQGIMNANYLKINEKMTRFILFFKGATVAKTKCKNKNVEDCVAEIESTDKIHMK